METFKSNDSLQLAYICVPAGLHARPTAAVHQFNYARTIMIILGSDYGYACPDAIQIKWSVCQANGMLLVA